MVHVLKVRPIAAHCFFSFVATRKNVKKLCIFYSNVRTTPGPESRAERMMNDDDDEQISQMYGKPPT